MGSLGLFLVIFGCLVPVNCELFADTFANTGCAKFFFKGTQPSNGFVPDSVAWICQRYRNQYHFSTLYDRKNRIPVYSAYIYKPGSGSRVDWLIEPQLVNKSYSKSMENEHFTKIDQQSLEKSQTVSTDYKQTSQTYDRGHLNPSLHNSNQNSKTATFTLTNIVPQHKKLNQGTWNIYEAETMKNMTVDCEETYAVVGVIPGDKYISNNRVNVPSHLWAAACCIRSNGQKSWAGIAENTEKNEVRVISLGELEKEISRLLNQNITLFHADCPRLGDFAPFTIRDSGNKPQIFTNFLNFSSIIACIAIFSLQCVVTG